MAADVISGSVVTSDKTPVPVVYSTVLIEVIDANGNTTKYRYTANGGINDVNDAKRNITRYEYDGFDRLIKIVYPDDSNETFSYDGFGRRTKFTDNRHADGSGDKALSRGGHPACSC